MERVVYNLMLISLSRWVCGVAQEHNVAGVHALDAYGPIGAGVAVAGAVAGEDGEDALLAEQQPGRGVRQAGAGGLRGGPGALAEGGPELVPHRHGHRLEDGEERHGHESRLRRVSKDHIIAGDHRELDRSPALSLAMEIG